MTDVAAQNQGLLNIGEQAKPPFAVLPDPKTLFKSRASRFSTLAPGHELEPYLRFLARLASAQHAAVASLAAAAAASPAASSPTIPADHADAAATTNSGRSSHVGMPPLGLHKSSSGTAFDTSIRALLEQLGVNDLPEATVAAVRSLSASTPEDLATFTKDVLDETGAAGGEDIARRALVSAGLQVHFARQAATLNAADLTSVADSACPSCGSAPVSSAVVNWPRASNTRFCTCSLCATMWNVVRVKCVLCSATGGISYRAVEGKPDAVKAECCEACQAYVKLLNQTQDPALEAVADDVATLGLDMLMSGEGWKRGGRNPFLLGY